MPILKVKVSGEKSTQKSEDIKNMLSDVTQRILGKKPEVTSILIEFVPTDSWYVAGDSLKTAQKSSFYFDIKITDETNTKDEKARYIQEAYDGFCRILGDVHEESYIHIEDVRAGTYGYGGKTQEYRYHA